MGCGLYELEEHRSLTIEAFIKPFELDEVKEAQLLFRFSFFDRMRHQKRS